MQRRTKDETLTKSNAVNEIDQFQFDHLFLVVGQTRIGHLQAELGQFEQLSAKSIVEDDARPPSRVHRIDHLQKFTVDHLADGSASKEIGTIEQRHDHNHTDLCAFSLTWEYSVKSTRTLSSVFTSQGIK